MIVFTICRRIYLAYMDSVHFFKPRQFRTAVYHEILIGYLDYVKILGYVCGRVAAFSNVDWVYWVVG